MRQPFKVYLIELFKGLLTSGFAFHLQFSLVLLTFSVVFDKTLFVAFD